MPVQRVFDLEEAVKQWAWYEYGNTESRSQKKLRKKEEKSPGMYVGVEIDWNHIIFSDQSHWSQLIEGQIEDETKTTDTAADEDGRTLTPVVDISKRAEQGEVHVSTLFQTKFTNNTDEDQEYTMKTEKTTRSEYSTQVENSWSRGWQVGIGLKTPYEILEANAGYSREVSLTNTDSQTFEEQLHWGVESQIKVKGRHVAEASLIVSERKYNGDFTVETRVKGMVYITFTNIQDSNALMKATGDNIKEIVDWYLKRERRKELSYPFVEFEKKEVIITTKGKCHFRFGVRQEVRVDQKKL